MEKKIQATKPFLWNSFQITFSKWQLYPVSSQVWVLYPSGQGMKKKTQLSQLYISLFLLVLWEFCTCFECIHAPPSNSAHIYPHFQVTPLYPHFKNILFIFKNCCWIVWFIIIILRNKRLSRFTKSDIGSLFLAKSLFFHQTKNSNCKYSCPRSYSTQTENCIYNSEEMLSVGILSELM